MELNRSPLIVDIARYSVHDGPGIRSVVFFKGCPLRCMFCHNPETQNPGPEIAFFENKCIRCGACLKVCPSRAINLELHYPVLRHRCNACGNCAIECPSGALHLFGQYYPIEELTDILARDLDYYQNSGGGVTISGGECAMFPEYLSRLLKNLKQLDIHVLIETSGYFDYDKFRTLLLPYVDMIYYDIKFAKAGDHQKYCGKSNTRILENLVNLTNQEQVIIEPRVPLIPGSTDSDQNLSDIAFLLGKLGKNKIWTLPYNPAGIIKYKALGRPHRNLPSNFMAPEEVSRIQEYLHINSVQAANAW